MKCPNCGIRISRHSRFCDSCGFEIPKTAGTSKAKAPQVAAMDMECPNCSAQMELDPEGKILICPYCGSKKYLTESDDVKKERIRNETIRENHKAKLEYESKRREEESKEVVHAKGTMAWIIIFALTTAATFSDQQYVSGIIALAQTIMMLAVWLCKKRHLLPKNSILFTLLKVVPFLLIIAFVSATDLDADLAEKAKQNETIKARMKEGENTYVWPGTDIAALLPKAQYEHGNLIKSSEQKLELEIYHVSQSEYDDYIRQCKEAGFTYYEVSKDGEFEADNADHYHLELGWTEDKDTFNTMTIKLDAPYSMKEIKWPSTDMTADLPVPPSMVGHIRVSNNSQLFCYIADVSQEQFEAYVQECVDKGFTSDYIFPTITTMKAPGQTEKTLRLRLQNWNVMQILYTIGE